MSPDILTLEYIESLKLPPLILYAVPVMLFLVMVEWYIGWRKNLKLYNPKDFLASAAIGTGNLVVNALIKVALLGIFIFAYNLSSLRIQPTWWSFVLCVFAVDLARYWGHRLSHEMNFLWATHVTHHSSPNYNFAVSFRLSWTQHIKIFFFVPIAFLGFHPVIFFIVTQIATLYQFWIHTELIRKLPKPIEYIFTTPSHHRVHHATNDKYIDKNYGSTFIIWDRMFGTFQSEDEKPVYGITKPVNSYNPITLNFHVWGDIFRELRQARSLRDVKTILIGYPGTFSAAKEKAKSPNLPEAAEEEREQLRA